MTATLEPVSAAEVYRVSLEPRRRSPLGRVVAGALDLWCATTGGRMELSRAGDLVVRRQHDGIAELRMPLPAADAVADLVALVHEQLDELSPEEFRTASGLA